MVMLKLDPQSLLTIMSACFQHGAFPVYWESCKIIVCATEYVYRLYNSQKDLAHVQRLANYRQHIPVIGNDIARCPSKLPPAVIEA